MTWMPGAPFPASTPAMPCHLPIDPSIRSLINVADELNNETSQVWQVVLFMGRSQARLEVLHWSSSCLQDGGVGPFNHLELGAIGGSSLYSMDVCWE